MARRIRVKKWTPIQEGRFHLRAMRDADRTFTEHIEHLREAGLRITMTHRLHMQYCVSLAVDEERLHQTEGSAA